MDMVTLTIDGQEVKVPQGSTILEAAEKVGVHIPTLCHHPDQEALKPSAGCVWSPLKAIRLLQPACAFPAAEGMVVRTNTPAVREARRVVVELILSRHPEDCLKCERNLNCELQTVAEHLGFGESVLITKTGIFPWMNPLPSLVRDMDKCILCRRCVNVCGETQGASVLYPINRGYDTMIGTAVGNDLVEVACALCGQCINVCPTGALTEKDETEQVWEALGDPEKHVIVQTAPAIRVSISEEMGIPPGDRFNRENGGRFTRLGLTGFLIQISQQT
jgi:NADP-reducing hydrogenase subunit HndD